MVYLSHYRTLTSLDRLTKNYDQKVYEWRDSLTPMLNPDVVSTIFMHLHSCPNYYYIDETMQAMLQHQLVSAPACSTPVHFEQVNPCVILASPGSSRVPPDCSMLSSGSVHISTRLCDSHHGSEVASPDVAMCSRVSDFVLLGMHQLYA